MIELFASPPSKQHGGCALCFSDAQICNSLLFALHHSPSLPAFKPSLKTYLFKQYFDQEWIFCCTNLELSLSLSLAL